MATTELIGDEIHAPYLIRSCRSRLHYTQHRTSAPTWCFRPNPKPFFTIEPVNPFDIDLPAFATQKYMQPPVPVLHT